ncbi:hypothetical protein EW146_g9569 [Bondarzewia mesenterica]|uniref:Uncharacterized protein n=1 Tax=Bondarzewia mesenterica TaxID=1095465 RepID=A0A4S4L6Z3_9AGAM|nr:hypothetical protein EW146_g9569 [Bondarzewia mesenterica]
MKQLNGLLELLVVNELQKLESAFVNRDWRAMLNTKFLIHNIDDPTEAEDIEEEHGYSFSIFDTLPNWQGPLSLLIELMHMFYLGITEHVHRKVLIDGAFLRDLWVPGTLERLNPKIATGGGRPKANDWRNLVTVYPVTLAVIWDM